MAAREFTALVNGGESDDPSESDTDVDTLRWHPLGRCSVAVDPCFLVGAATAVVVLLLCSALGLRDSNVGLATQPIAYDINVEASDWHPIERHGQQKVKSHVWCQSLEWAIGNFPTLDLCTDAVKGAGGKYFSYSTVFAQIGGNYAGGHCYIHYTRSRECTEGFIWSPRYSFYDIPDAAETSWSSCDIDILNVTISDTSNFRKQDHGFLYRRMIDDNKLVTVASYVEKQQGLLSSKVCRVENVLDCIARVAIVRRWESCCTPGWGSSSCQPPQKVVLTGSHVVLRSDGDIWEIGGPKHRLMDFEADFRTEPPLDTSGVLEPHLSIALVSRSYELREIYNGCPSWVKTSLRVGGYFTKLGYADSLKKLDYEEDKDVSQDPFFLRLIHKSANSSILDPSVFDEYTMFMAAALIHGVLTHYGGRRDPAIKRISIPMIKQYIDRFVVYNFRGSPTTDIDMKQTPELSKSAGCIFDAVRATEFSDGFDSGKNDWKHLFRKHRGRSVCPFAEPECSKKRFVLGVFAGYKTLDGDPVYPKEEINFQRLFLSETGKWSDLLEHFIAFRHLGSHQLRRLSTPLSRGGATAVFTVPTLDIAGLEVREGFARPGADMYFSMDGQPLMVRTPEGGDVWRNQVNDEIWQYWKFAWRSSVFLRVTLVDHLYATHYGTAGMLAGASRETLPALHPLRRLFSIFTWGTITVNANAIHQLIGGKQLLDRSTPFFDFQKVTMAAEEMVPTLRQRFEIFVENASDPIIHSSPFFKDGQLLFNALQDLVNRWLNIYTRQWCGHDDVVRDTDIQFFFTRLSSWSLTKGSRDNSDSEWLRLRTADGRITCSGMRRWLAVVFFGVTGYHRHVGTVGDYASDPDLASFAWTDQHAYGPPRQHFQMALISASTAKIMIKIDEDFSFLAEGIDHEDEATTALRDFRAKLRSISEVVASRNVQRDIPYINMDPKVVECAVSV